MRNCGWYSSQSELKPSSCKWFLEVVDVDSGDNFELWGGNMIFYVKATTHRSSLVHCKQDSNQVTLCILEAATSFYASLSSSISKQFYFLHQITATSSLRWPHLSQSAPVLCRELSQKATAPKALHPLRSVKRLSGEFETLGIHQFIFNKICLTPRGFINVILLDP